MIQGPEEDWSFATARQPARFGAGERRGGPAGEHAMTDSGTLCGIPESHITRYRHLFVSQDPQACPRCRQGAAAAPLQPSAQERLHHLVRTAVAGSARDDLLAALEKGARVALWLRGPTATLSQHYAQLGTLTEGAEHAGTAFDAAPTIGLARVQDDSWTYLVVLPEDEGRPLVARGPRSPA
ncbi:hypothetical protein [Streptomyces durhamensis]|uniref:hypothetical protein n=1 Tax=Streptomyces durhamensis TaxID=68194 RepID=UPI0012FE84EC|nr:hypothetical protein [Streptomyces durhamensis]